MLIPEKTEFLLAELNKRAEAATGGYSATGDLLQYIYSVLVTKDHQKFRSGSLVHEFSFKEGAAILKKNYLWLLPFFIVMATYCYYEKVRGMVRTAIASYLLKSTLTYI